MSQTTNPNIVTLTVTQEAAHFILDCVADRPFKQVAPLLNELQAQVQVQANTQGAETVEQPASASADQAATEDQDKPKPKRDKGQATTADSAAA